MLTKIRPFSCYRKITSVLLVHLIKRSKNTYNQQLLVQDFEKTAYCQWITEKNFVRRVVQRRRKMSAIERKLLNQSWNWIVGCYIKGTSLSGPLPAKGALHAQHPLTWEKNRCRRQVLWNFLIIEYWVVRIAVNVIFFLFLFSKKIVKYITNGGRLKTR